MAEHATTATVTESCGAVRRRRKRRQGSRPAKPTLTPPAVPTVDARGYPRSAPTLPGAGKGRPSPLRGRTFPPDPPPTDEIVQLLQAMPETPQGRRLRALVIVMWRSGLRVSEALALQAVDLDQEAGSLFVRCGKGAKHRVIGMDRWAWGMLEPWLLERESYPQPRGPIFCVVQGPTAGIRAMGSAQVRHELRRLTAELGIKHRTSPHQFRHRLSTEYREDPALDLYTLSEQLGHADMGVTTRYLRSIPNEVIIKAAVNRKAPMMAVPDLMKAFRVR